ncbi:UDP-glycosyltransferase 76G1-like protein [Tanacetum coccineum]
MKLSWRGKQYKELLWKSATSSTVQLFEKNMEELRMINKEVYDWLKLIPPIIGPGELYQATGPHGTQYVCNMTQRTCLCKKWDLTRIPCKHAVACIWDMASNGQVPGIPESWVSECYWLSTWQEMYRFKVNPCRPQKKRKKSAAELFDDMVKKKSKRFNFVNQSQSLLHLVSAKGQQATTSPQTSVTSNASAPTAGKTAPFPSFLRPTAPFVTPRFTKTTANRLSPIKKSAGANGKGKNVQE